MGKEDAAEVLTIEGREVRITHPDKPYFTRQTKLSKLDLVRYYLSIAPCALAGIRDRPVVILVFPVGVAAIHVGGGQVLARPGMFRAES